MANPWQQGQRRQKGQRHQAKHQTPRLIKAHELIDGAGTSDAQKALHSISPKLAKPLRRALLAVKAGRLVEALQQFQVCAEIDPANKAVLYFGSDAAQRAYFSLKYTDPKPPAAFAAKWREAALTLTLACAEAAPHDPVAAHNAGRFLQDDGDDRASIPIYEHALTLDRTQVESWGNLGNALYTIGETERAELCWSKCVAFDALNPSGKMAQAYVWLRRGDYARGWAALNERWRDQSFAISYGRPDLKGTPWTGQPLRKGDSLLVHGEQGLGDHVQFARYIPVLIEQGLTIAGLETRHPLKTWFQACLPNTPIVARYLGGDQAGDPLPAYTHHVALMSLPGILGLPEFAKPLAPFAWTKPERAGKRVGIVWQGTPGNPMDFLRSIPVHELNALADAPGITWVPLQYDPSGQSELQASLWLGDVEATPSYRDVLGLGQAMIELDAVVAVDTLAAHVAGSVGVPTVILHRFFREWRWGQFTETTDWYPSVTNLTQREPGNWTELLTRVREHLPSAMAF